MRNKYEYQNLKSPSIYKVYVNNQYFLDVLMILIDFKKISWFFKTDLMCSMCPFCTPCF